MAIGLESTGTVSMTLVYFDYSYFHGAHWTALFIHGLPWVAQTVKHLPAMWVIWVWSLGQEDPLEKEMATHSSILAWRIPRTEEPDGLQSIGSQRVRHNEVTNTLIFSHPSTHHQSISLPHCPQNHWLWLSPRRAAMTSPNPHVFLQWNSKAPPTKCWTRCPLSLYMDGTLSPPWPTKYDRNNTMWFPR